MWQEDNLTEFKAELNDKLEKEVVAFLNSEKGGDIYIGIADNGTCLGIDNPDQLQLMISDRIKNNIEPSCLGLFDVYPIEKEKKTIIKIVISRGTEKPYYIKKFGMSPKGCFVRKGSGVQQMDRTMIDAYYTRRTHTSLRNIVSPKFDLTFEQLKIYYQAKGLNINDSFLKNLDFYTEDGKFNYVAYLMSDNNTLSIKVAKYSGSDKVDLVENEEFGFCSIVKATKSILDKLQIENRTFTKITGAAERLQKDMINKTALREALINAMVHNNYSREITPVVEIYSDRLSITSYGGLVSGLSKEEFFQGRSMPRNREIMRVFRDLELVEHLGSGVHRILKAYDKSIFQISENFFEISFPFEKDYLELIKNEKIKQQTKQETDQVKKQDKQLTNSVIDNNTDPVTDPVTDLVTDLVKKLLITIATDELSPNEIRNKLNLKHRQTFRKNYINPATEQKLIEMTIPDKPNSRNQKYRLTKKGIGLRNKLINKGK